MAGNVQPILGQDTRPYLRNRISPGTSPVHMSATGIYLLLVQCRGQFFIFLRVSLSIHFPSINKVISFTTCFPIIASLTPVLSAVLIPDSPRDVLINFISGWLPRREMALLGQDTLRLLMNQYRGQRRLSDAAVPSSR